MSSTTSEMTVVGAGSGGLAPAAWAASAGWRVRLYDVDSQVLEPIRERGGFEVKGRISGRVSPVFVGDDPVAAVDGVDLVAVVVPGGSVADAAQAVGALLEPGAPMLVIPGGTGGALQAKLAANSPRLLVGEADAFPFVCSKPDSVTSVVSDVKQSFGVATSPPERVGEVIDLLTSLFPGVRAAGSLWETSLLNMNAVLHVMPMLANASRIELGGERFRFYEGGISPAVARLVTAYDAERVCVAQALGVPTLDVLGWIEVTYGVGAHDLHAALRELCDGPYAAVMAPPNLSSRYLTEDVPCGTVPVAALAGALGVPAPLHNAAVAVASVLCGDDFAQTGRSLARLGLAGLSPDELRAASA